jgi:hypothetical protein
MNTNLSHKPGLFIGIGGSGVKSLARLKANMYQLYKNNDKLSSFNDHKFIFIDTDSNDISDINKNQNLLGKMDDKKPIEINKGEFIDIGTTVPDTFRQQFSRSSGNEKHVNHIKSWLILDDDNPDFRLIQNSLSTGAGASRIDGRVGFINNYTSISEAINSAITQLSTLAKSDWEKDATGRDDGGLATNFWVISGTNGGTGSSMTLDILFLIDRIFQRNHTSKPAIKLALLAPQPYVNKSKFINNIKLNSFAFFWELNAFRTPRPKWQNHEGDWTPYFNYLFSSNDYKDNSYTGGKNDWNVFDYCIVFDTQSKDSRVKIEIEDTFDNVANTLISLACLGGGKKIDSRMINTLLEWEKSGEGKVVTKKPKIIEGLVWGNYVAATSNKVITKPINDLKIYIRNRVELEILRYGLIGKSLENSYNNDVEKQKTELLNILNEKLLDDIVIKTQSAAGIVNNLNNIYISISTEFKQITDPNDIDIKKESFLGIERGFKKGAFSEIWDTFKVDVQSKIDLIKRRYNENESNYLGKSQLLNRINEKIEAFINESVINFGFQYTYDVIRKLDTDLENIEGEKYLGDLNLKNIEKKLNNEYSNTKFNEKISSIEGCIEENKDLETFKQSISSYFKFQQERLILVLKQDIIKNLCIGRDGILDKILKSDEEKGIGPVLEKLKSTLETTERSFEKLATRFGSENNPLKVYLPPLSLMVDGENWRKNSDFDKIFSEIFPRDASGSEPSRNGIKSLSEFLNDFVLSIPQQKITFPSSTIFSEVVKGTNIKFKSFKDLLLKIEDAEDRSIGYFEDKFVQNNSAVTNWIKIPLSEEFDNMIDTNKSYFDQFKKEFSKSDVLYPTNSINSVETMYIYSGSKELKKTMAVELGYIDGNDNYTYVETDNNSELNKIVFEIGHNLGEYKYLEEEYASFYERMKPRIDKYEFGCHIHKHFNHLNLDKTMREVVPGFQVGKFIEKVFAIHLTYYSALFDLMKTDEENKDILNLLFKPSVPNPFTKTSTETFPLLWMQDKNNVFYVRKLVLDSASKMLSGNGKETVTIQNARDYGDLMIKSLDNNAKFKDQVDLLSLAFRENQSKIGIRIKAFIEANHDTIFPKAAEISNKSWDLEMDKKTMELIMSQYNEIRSSHVFQ